MPSTPTLTVLSLGGGVQSSVMALMAGESLPPTGSGGAFDRVPDCAVFADTRWEPPSIYEHLEWLKDRLSFPLYVVDNGRSLREDVKALTNHSGSRSYVDIPVYLKGRDGQGDGIGRRQCTDSYKIRPIRRRIRQLLGPRPRQRVPSGVTVELWLGISTDEAIRMKDSRACWPSMLAIRSGHLNVPIEEASPFQYLPSHFTRFGAPLTDARPLTTGAGWSMIRVCHRHTQ